MRIFYSYMSNEISLERAIIDYWDTFLEAPKSVICSPKFHQENLVGKHPELKIFVETQLLLTNQFILSSVESIHEASDHLIGSRKDVTLKTGGDGVPPRGLDQEGRVSSHSSLGLPKINDIHTAE